MESNSIPVLDFNDKYKPEFIEAAGKALEEVGFFSLVNHGIDPLLLKSAFSVSKRFFEFPEELKRKYDTNSKGQFGYTGFGAESAKDSDKIDLKEFWHVNQLSKPENVWPEEIPEFQYVMSDLYKKCEFVAEEILWALESYLKAPEGSLSDAIDNGNTVLRALYYPEVEPDKYPGSIRAEAHEDINFITLLCESTAPGLELLQKDGTWLPVHRQEGAIIVNSSDMLHNISNGIFRSTTHRVVNPEPEDRSARFSMPCFIHPRSDVDLSPLQVCVDRVGEKRTRDINAIDFLMERLNELGL